MQELFHSGIWIVDIIFIIGFFYGLNLEFEKTLEETQD